MKACLLLLLIVSAVSSTKSKGLCIDKNAFVQRLKDQQVSIFKFAKKEKVSFPDLPQLSKCADEWSEKGSCCGKATFERFVQMDAVKIELATYQAKKSMKVAFDFFNEVMAAAKELKETHQPASSKEGKKILDLANHTKLASFRKLMARSNDPRFLSKSFDRCWSYMSEVRSQGQCYSCSGKSQKYFGRDRQFMRVNYRTCYSILSVCGKAFRRMFNFVTGLDYFLDLLRETLDPKRLGLLQRIEELDKLVNAILKNSVLKKSHMLMFRSLPLTLSKKNKLKKAVCRSLVSISKPTLIQKMAPMFALKELVFDGVTHILHNKIISSKDTWDLPTGRSLLSGSLSEAGINISDIELSSKGLSLGMGTSYNGGDGSSWDRTGEVVG